MEQFRAVVPNQSNLPRRIARLGKFAYNLWRTWNPDAQRLFSRIDADLWERSHHNPVVFLRQVNRARLKEITKDRYYLDCYDRVLRAFDQFIQSKDTWLTRTYPERENKLIAYFSSEFGLHETLPIYAAGWVCFLAITSRGREH